VNVFGVPDLRDCNDRKGATDDEWRNPFPVQLVSRHSLKIGCS
jgi:hypothetical protein